MTSFHLTTPFSELPALQDREPRALLAIAGSAGACSHKPLVCGARESLDVNDTPASPTSRSSILKTKSSRQTEEQQRAKPFTVLLETIS